MFDTGITTKDSIVWDSAQLFTLQKSLQKAIFTSRVDRASADGSARLSTSVCQCHSRKYGKIILKMKSTIRSMRYMRKSYSGEGIYSNSREELRGERNLSLKQQSGSSFGTKMPSS